jgi:hemerythrin-like domain-containing protein
MDAIRLLREDHREMERLFKAFEKAGDNAKATKRRLAEKIIEGLSVHAVIEEQLFYPAVRAEIEDTEDEVFESLEEHHVVKWLLSEIDKIEPGHERFDAKMSVLIENVRHHVREEESELFPDVRSALGRSRLGELGDAMEKLKRVAPKKPHPRSPDEPPANIVTGAVASVVDRAREAIHL